MRNKNKNFGNSQPRVVMIFEQEEDVIGAANILVSQIENYRSIRMNDKTTKFLIKEKPSVILFALADVAKCIEYYATLVEEKQLNYPHYSVLMCNNKESALAFRCCMKGLFDNYFVYLPLYEKFRLVMIVQNGLSQTLSLDNLDKFNEENFEQIDEDLAQLIDESGQCRQKLLDTIKQSQQKIADFSQQDDLSEKIPTDELISTITQEHVKPLMSLLENDIKSSLDGMIAQLLSKQANLKKQAEKSKGLLNKQTFNKPTSAKILENIKANIKVEATKTLEQSTKATQQQERILVVDDNGLYRDMLINVLKKENFDVVQAEDGINALHKIKQEQFDLIIMDLYMPKLDGLNTTKQIRTLSGGKDIPVIALTGNKNKEIVKKWAAYGLKGYIIKPSTKEEILECVNRVMTNLASSSASL
jgi:CheY-like chemotaxis protein